MGLTDFNPGTMRSGILFAFIVLSLVLLSSARRPSKGGKGGGRPSKGGKGGKGGRPSTGTTKPPSTGGYGNGYGKPSKGREREKVRGKEKAKGKESQNHLQPLWHHQQPYQGLATVILM